MCSYFRLFLASSIVYCYSLCILFNLILFKQNIYSLSFYNDVGDVVELRNVRRNDVWRIEI